MNLGAPNFHQGIEPTGCEVFFCKIPFWNWTTILLTKQPILTKNDLKRHTVTYIRPPDGFLFHFRCFLFAWERIGGLGVNIVGTSYYGIEPVDDEQKGFRIPFWNWTWELWCLFWINSILELNHNFSSQKHLFLPFLTQFDTRLPIYHPRPLSLWSPLFPFRPFYRNLCSRTGT